RDRLCLRAALSGDDDGAGDGVHRGGRAGGCGASGASGGSSAGVRSGGVRVVSATVTARPFSLSAFVNVLTARKYATRLSSNKKNGKPQIAPSSHSHTKGISAANILHPFSTHQKPQRTRRTHRESQRHRFAFLCVLCALRG